MAGGERPGELELLAEPLEGMVRAARMLGEQKFRDAAGGCEGQLPELTRGLLLSRQLARRAQHRRGEMPVIDEEDIPALRMLLRDICVEELCYTCQLRADQLRPSQCQIYVDRSISATARIGMRATRELLLGQHLVVDSEGTIVDGHHRWLSAMMIDSRILCLVYRFRARAEDVLAQLLGFSDARHMRNQ